MEGEKNDVESNSLMKPHEELQIDDTQAINNEDSKEVANSPPKKKTKHMATTFICMTGAGLIVSGQFGTREVLTDCPNFSVFIFNAGIFFIIVGSLSVSLGIVSVLLEKYRLRISRIVLVYVCPLMVALLLAGLCWTSFDLFKLDQKRGAYEQKMINVYEPAKSEFIQFWSNNALSEELLNRKCWLNIERKGICCGLNGPQDWLNISGQISPECECFLGRKGFYPSNCHKTQIPRLNKTMMILQNGCRDSFHSSQRQILIAMLSMSCIGVAIHAMTFYIRLSKIRKIRQSSEIQ